MTSDADVALSALVRQFPSLVLQNVIVVTSWDSGPLQTTEAERSLGWTTRKCFAYSPIVQSIDDALMSEESNDWPDYSEIYLLDQLRDVGQEFNRELSEFHAQHGEVLVFINYPAFAIHRENGPPSVLTDWFWQQFEWMKPVGYLAKSETHLTAVHRDRGLILELRDWLSA